MVMNELQEKAEIYAAEKMNELMAKAIAQAYIDGYLNGCKDQDTKKWGLDYLEGEINVGDIGLPSGTLWSLDYLKDEENHTNYLPYAKAAKLGLPTKEQVEELVENCEWFGQFSASRMTLYSASCYGPNGKKIFLETDGYMKYDEKVDASYGGAYAYFWIQDDEDGYEKNAVRISYIRDGKPLIEIVKLCSGYKLPVLVVRK